MEVEELLHLGKLAGQHIGRIALALALPSEVGRTDLGLRSRAQCQ
jgi:hypothetical protein